MNILIWIITSIFILLLTNLVNIIYKNKKIEKNILNNIIKPNKNFFRIGIICFFVMIIGPLLMLIFGLFDSKYSNLEIYLSIGGIYLISLIDVYIIFFGLNYRIIVYDNYFIYQNFWRIKKQIYFKDIIIDNSKLNPQVRLKKENGKTKVIFKLAGVLENEDCFMKYYREWKKLPKTQREQI